MRKLTFLKFIILFLISFYTYPVALHCQSLFTVVPTINESLTQTAMKNDLTTKSYASNVRVININSISSAQSNGVITVNFPSDTTDYLYKINYFSNVGGTTVWNGELMTNETAVDLSTPFISTLADSTIHGFLTLIEKDGKIFGSVSLDSNYYQIRNYGSNRVALVKTNKNYDPICNIEGLGSPIESDPEEEELESRDVCDITAIVFVSEGIALSTPDINDLIILEIERTNIIIANSKARFGANRVILKSINNLPSSEWTAQDDNDHKIIDDVKYLIEERDAQDADLVFVISPDVHLDWKGASTNFGDDNSTAESEAFAIIDVEFLNGEDFVFTHEFGHLMGCRHHSGVDGNDPFCFNGADPSGLSHSHGWKVEKIRPWPQTNKTFATVMTVCGAFINGRMMNFSNPDVKWKKKRTGKNELDSESCSSNNAKTIRQATCRISSYFVENISSINITGKHFGCPDEVISLSGHIENITGTITYTWQTSLDGFSYYNTQSGTTSTYLVTLPDIEYITVFIKLNVQSSTGANLTKYYEIQVMPDPIHCDEHRKGKKVKAIFSDNLIIYPSPASSHVSATLASNSTLYGDMELFNSIGQTVYVKSINLSESALKTLTIDISRLHAGIYFCRYKNELNQITSKAFIIN
ncbi:MAG: zinc-dependent metalloprotease [Saprospiraceae bacterium]|nr:zinc-dependent metalloprotease [Saprospiraceae bacterium]